jgi:hypothetical protein
MNLIWIGDHFYRESSTVMSSIYEVDGTRSDWGKIQLALINGEEVHIRQATKKERDRYEAQLLNLIRDRP